MYAVFKGQSENHGGVPIVNGFIYRIDPVWRSENGWIWMDVATVDYPFKKPIDFIMRLLKGFPRFFATTIPYSSFDAFLANWSPLLSYHDCDTLLEIADEINDARSDGMPYGDYELYRWQRLIRETIGAIDDR